MGARGSIFENIWVGGEKCIHIDNNCRATKAWKYLTWLSSHFDSFKRSCSVAQSVPFLTTDINNFRLPKGDFEIVQCSSGTCTAHVGFAWDKRGLLYHTMLSLCQI